MILGPTEAQYRQLNRQPDLQLDTIVVLGCDSRYNPRLSANMQLGSCALSRLVEGVRLARLYPRTRIWFTGASNAPLMKGAAVSLGIDKARIHTLEAARDTMTEARELGPYLVDSNVALVTSVAHMPRARDLFKAQGISVYPAPADFFSLHSQPATLYYLPSSTALGAITQHWHELLGRAWISLRRSIDPEAL